MLLPYRYSEPILRWINLKKGFKAEVRTLHLPLHKNQTATLLYCMIHNSLHMWPKLFIRDIFPCFPVN